MSSVEAAAWIALLACFITHYQMRRANADLERARAERRSIADARQELEEFVLLWNYGAISEAYEHLKQCGFAVHGDKNHDVLGKH